MSKETTTTKETRVETVVTAVVLNKGIQSGIVDKHYAMLLVPNKDLKEFKGKFNTVTDSVRRNHAILAEKLGKKCPNLLDHSIVTMRGKEYVSGLELGASIEIGLGIENNYAFAYDQASYLKNQELKALLIEEGLVSSEEEASSELRHTKRLEAYDTRVAEITRRNEISRRIASLKGKENITLLAIPTQAEFFRNMNGKRGNVNKVAVPVKDMSKMDEIFDK